MPDDEITLGGRKWKIQWKAKTWKDYGECDRINGVLRLRKGQTIEELMDTLLHEGLHAVEQRWDEHAVEEVAKDLRSLLMKVLFPNL